MKFELYRNYYKEGVNSTLFCEGILLCFMIELPWKDNKKNCSCIPEGSYKLKIRHSNKFGEHLILNTVLNRDMILIHPANDALKELKGCLAPVTYITGIGRGNQSKKALNVLIAQVKIGLSLNEKIILIIKKGNYEISRTLSKTNT